MGKIKATTDGKKGGILYGKSHAQGGIKAVVTDAGNKEVELEGGEAVVKKSALKDKTVKTLTGTNAQILNLINTRAGGNPIYAPSEVKMKNGGRVGNGGKLGVLTTSDNIKVSGFNHYQKTKKNGNFYKVFAEKNINNNRFELWWIFFTIKDGVKKLGTIRYRFENEKKDINKEYIISFDDLPSSLKEVYNNISETYKEGGNPIYAPSEVKMAKGGGVNTDIISPYLENLKINGIVLYDKDLIVLMYNTGSQKRNKNLYSPTILRKYLNDYSEEVVNQLTLDLAMEWYDLFDEKDIPKYLKHDRIIIVNNSQVVFDNQANMAKGGSIEDNCISFIKNSEAIKNNGYFHYFKNISIYADFGTKVPKTKSFYLCAYNSGGQKNLKVTDTLNLDLINKLQEIIDCEKSICRIIVDEFFRKAKRIESNDLSRMTGENIIVVDRYNIVCDNIKNEFSSGGSITPSAINNMTKAEQKAFYKTKEGKELDKQTYTKWKSLVNMSKGELESFYNSKEGKEAGLSASEAKAEGIDSGRESARWIMKMKDIPYTEWTSNMWVWAKKQISFVSRMKGMRGDLYDDKGNKTRKHLALLIWGHNPKKMAEGGVIPQQGTLFTKDKKNKLDYKKVGNDYVFKVYDVESNPVESNPVENYTRHQYKKRNNNEATMDYNQFINYLYSEHYIDDKKMAEGGSINNMTKAEWIIDGKESTREDFQEIYQRALSNSDDGIYNLNAKKVEYLGDEEQAIKEIKDYNRITDIYTKNGELKRHYMEAVISKAFNEISFRKFGNAFRKNIDESFSQERKKESLMNTKMSWLELASYIIGDVGYYLRSENDFRAFAKELGIDIPKNKTNDADIEMAEGGNVWDSKLLAPNGKPSNLTAEQYKLVRTAAFKKWFGDWENDSANASKVVDENGEPLVVYHGTASDFNIFKIGRTGGIFFTNNKNSAERFSSGDLKRIGANPKTLNCFLNIKKYYDKNTNDKILVDNYYQDYFQNRPFIKKQSQKNILKNKFNKYFMDLVSFGIVNEEPLNFLIEKEYDGIIIDAHNNSNSYIVFNSNQIKLADGTNTTFDGSNADIRFAEGGVTGDVFSIKDPEQFKQLITLYNKFSEKFDVDNYFVDDSSVVFLRKVKFTDAELKGMAQYIADLSKNQNFSIISDKKPEISNGYFKFFLKERVRYKDGGNVEDEVITYRNKFNKKYGFELNESHSLKQIAKLTGLKLSALQDIYNKGIGAYKTNPSSVRPNVKSKEQWAMARVYSAVMGGKASKVDENELERGKMAEGGNVGEITFKDYKGEQIMYEPHNREYFVIGNDENIFNSLEDAKAFIDNPYGAINTEYAKMAAAETKELQKGIKVEQEHEKTFKKVAKGKISVKDAIKETAEEHIAENPNYYDELEKIEGGSVDSNLKNALKDLESARSVKYWLEPEFSSEAYKYEQKGNPDSFVKIYDEKYNADTILAYNKRGNLVGLFSISKGGKEQGAFKIVVREDSMNQGWGKKLLDEAERQGIDIVGNIKNNSFTNGGRNLLKSWLSKKMKANN